MPHVLLYKIPISILGNSLTIYVIHRTRRLHNPCTPYLINVSCLDLAVSVLILPVIGINAVSGLVIFPLVMCKPLSVLFHVLTRMVCSFFCGKEAMERNNSVPPEEGMSSSKIPQILDLICVGIPFVSMVISYILIFIKMRRSRNSLSHLGMAAFNTHEKEMKFTRMMALTFSSVCFCFCLPMGINIFTSAQRGGESSLFSTTDLKLPESINVIAYIFLFVPFWTNPLIYILSNRNYRLAYLNLLTPKKWRRRRDETLRRTSTFQQTPRVLKKEEEERISRQNFKRIEFVPSVVP
ncbi:hypothetical protein TCAL_01074 [Tigriopus californicus]|uniref:G-protein coupled receptors family 1 profile domain-containing protein n=1 Tax=Tigriopus californicus TaxID=6832 RepID=A0A553P2B7_TIGCA|nr:hypothetical protein TCAL_01074 [Tigriopus californicus]